MKTRLRVEEILKRENISLNKLALEIGKNSPNLLQSLQINPTLDLLKKIATYFGIELSELIATSSKVYGYISIQIEEHEKVESFEDISSFKSSLKKIDAFIGENYDGEIKLFENGMNENINVFENIKDILNSQDCTDENFMDILKDICISINSKMEETDSQVNVYNLIKSLSKNPTLTKLSQVAESIGVETKYLLSLNPHIKIQGIVNLEGKIKTIESVNEFLQLKRIADEQYRSRTFNENKLQQYVESVLVTHSNNEPSTENYDYTNMTFTDEDYDMSLGSIIAANKNLCYSFRKNGDFRIMKTPNGVVSVSLNFSNMLKYEMTLFGVHFFDSECCYIAGAYTNDGAERERIQRELSNFSKGGYTAKGLYRKQDNVNTRTIRQDFNDYNFEWMKLVIWAKILSNPNGEFRNMLLGVPAHAYIIEDTSYHKGKSAQVWGCKNKELTAKRILKKAQVRHQLLNAGANKKTINLAEQMVDSSINDIGVWKGQNATGKALMICRKALENNTIPEIDIELLNSKNIYWNGNLIEIYIDELNQYNYRNI